MTRTIDEIERLGGDGSDERSEKEYEKHRGDLWRDWDKKREEKEKFGPTVHDPEKPKDWFADQVRKTLCP